jgi:hypothetical protein
VSAVGVQLLLLPTTTETAVLALRLPETPLMLTGYVPVAAEALAEKVSALDPVVGLVPNEAVTPDGTPEADKVTLPVNPPEGVMVIVSLAVPPWDKFTVGADGFRVKLAPLPTVMTKFCVLMQAVELS